MHCGNGTYFGFGALLIVEDIDVVLEIDTGFIKQINQYIPISKIPVILTCRDIPNDL